MNLLGVKMSSEDKVLVYILVHSPNLQSHPAKIVT